MARRIIWSVSPYDFISSSGERLIGTKVIMLGKKILTGTRTKPFSGVEMMEVKCENNALSSMTTVPSLFDMDLEAVLGSKGKSTTMVETATFVENIDIDLMHDPEFWAFARTEFPKYKARGQSQQAGAASTAQKAA